jgi:hypothetical protein
MALNLNTVSSFQTGTYPFPVDEIPLKEKDPNWGLRWCQAMYAAWVTDRTGVPYSRLDEYYTLRKYGAGSQDITKYQEILLDDSEDDGSLSGYLNIDWEIFSVMPKFKHIIRGMFEAQEFDIVASAVDAKSVKSKDKSRLEKWFKGRFKPLLDQLDKMEGAQSQSEWLPQNVDELELYSMAGGFKLAKETEIEEALNYSFYISDWKETKRKLLDDLGDLNVASVKDYTDTYTRKAKVRYVDPVNLIIQYSRHWDHRNAEYAGEVIRETISNIRKNTTIPEDELRNLAQFYNGRNRNQSLQSWNVDDLRMDGGRWRYDNFLIDIMDAEWFSVNSKYLTTRTNDRGDEYVYEEKDGKVFDSSKKKTHKSDYKVVYRCKWLVGTEHIYDFGLQYDVPRPGKKEVELSYKFYRLPGRSLVSLAVPNLDQMQLTWLKLQNALAMSANSGIAVEFSTLQNMKLGGSKMEPLEILSIRRDTGDLIYKTTTHQGRPNVPGGYKPIQELVGGIGPQLGEFLQLFEMNMELLRDLIGINRVADASAPDPNQSVGGSELAVAATSNALQPIHSAYTRLKEKVARTLAIRIQSLVKHDKKAYEGYMRVQGEAGVKIISFGADDIDTDWDIMLQAKPTQARKQMILESAMRAMQVDKDGFVGIEEQDFLMIERMLETGNLKYAEMFLTYRSRMNRERQLQVQRENMQLDQQGQQQAVQAKMQADQQLKQVENELKKDFETHKATLEDQNNQNEHDRKMEQISLEKSYTMAEKAQDAETAQIPI